MHSLPFIYVFPALLCQAYSESSDYEEVMAGEAACLGASGQGSATLCG